MDLVKVAEADGSWEELTKAWKAQCERYGESLDDYAIASMPILSDLAADSSNSVQRKAGVFALTSDGVFEAACHANVALLPGYKGPVLRMRHITFSPKFDYDSAIEINQYERALVGVFVGTLRLSYGEMKADHIKFHLRSPAERMFAQAFTKALDDNVDFSQVETKGAWLYLSKV